MVVQNDDTDLSWWVTLKDGRRVFLKCKVYTNTDETEEGKE